METLVNQLEELVKTLSTTQKQERDQDLYLKMGEVHQMLRYQYNLTEGTNVVTNILAEKLCKPMEIMTRSEEIQNILLETVQRIEIYNEIYCNDFSRIFNGLDKIEARISGIETIRAPDTVKMTNEVATLTEKIVNMEKVIDSMANILKKRESKRLESNNDAKSNSNMNTKIVQHTLIEDTLNNEQIIKAEEEAKEIDSSDLTKTKDEVQSPIILPTPRQFGLFSENRDNNYSKETKTTKATIPLPTTVNVGKPKPETTSHDTVPECLFGENKKRDVADIKKIFEAQSSKREETEVSSPKNNVSSSETTPTLFKSAASGTTTAADRQNSPHQTGQDENSATGTNVPVKNAASQIKEEGELNQPISPDKTAMDSRENAESSKPETISTPPPHDDKQTEANPGLPAGQNIYIYEKQDDRHSGSGEGLHEQLAVDTEEQLIKPEITYKCRNCKADLPKEMREDGISVKCAERECGHRNIVGILEEGNKWIFSYCNGKFHCYQVPKDTYVYGKNLKCCVCESYSSTRNADDWCALSG